MAATMSTEEDIHVLHHLLPLDPWTPPAREAACQASVCDAHRAGHPVPRQVSQEAESPKHGVAGRRMVWVLSNQGEWQLAPRLPNRISS